MNLSGGVVMEQVGIVKEVKGSDVVLEVRRVSACG